MTFTAPTVDEFKTRHCVFTSVDQAAVQAAISEALLSVDDSWIDQENYTNGVMLLAAHILTLDGHGTGAEAELSRAGALGFTSMRSGQLSLQRGAGAESKTDAGSLKSTQYGARFRKLQRLNHPAVAVT